MASTQPTAVVVLIILLVCGDARVETRLASSFNRKNRALEGASSIWNGTVVSAALCLSACLKLNGQSMTYGEGECNVYATYLCHPEDRFRLSLVSATGVTYFDLYSDPNQIRVTSEKQACVIYGRCVEKCDEGSWTAAAATSTASVLLSEDSRAAFEGPFLNYSTSSEHDSTLTIPPHLHPATSEHTKGPTSLNSSSSKATNYAESQNTKQNNLISTAQDPSIPGSGEGNTHGNSSINNNNSIINNSNSNSNSNNNSINSNSNSSSSSNSSSNNSINAVTDLKVSGRNSTNGSSIASDSIGQAEKIGSGLLVIQSLMAFDDALEHCVKKHMNLAMPETRDDHATLVQAMKRKNIARMWIGVKKITEGGTDATYVDGRAISKQLLLWGEGQPNNSRGGQICVEMNAVLKYLWNDYDCLYRAAFVCR